MNNESLDVGRSSRIGLAFLVCFILTLISFFAILLLTRIPLFRNRKRTSKQIFVESLFFAFAIGVLLGTTVFHLIPEVFGIDLQHHSEESSHDDPSSHEHEGSLHGENNSCLLSPKLGTLSLMIGLILVLVYDSFFRHTHNHQKCESIGGSSFTGKDLDSEVPKESVDLKPQKSPKHQESHPNDGSDNFYALDIASIPIDLNPKVGFCDLDSKNHESQECHIRRIESCPKPGKILAFGWSSLLSELVHNFTDGVLIGLTFQVSSRVGWATSLAIFAHELPQELCDFFILKAAGFTTTKILICNVIVSLSCFAGVALTLFQVSPKLAQFFIGLAAGSFLAITLTQLWPQLKQQFECLKGRLQVYCRLGSFFTGVVGTILILLMAFYLPHEAHNDSC